jgi:hypothetical protein
MTGTFIKELMKKAFKGGVKKTTGTEVIKNVPPGVGGLKKSREAFEDMQQTFSDARKNLPKDEANIILSKKTKTGKNLPMLIKETGELERKLSRGKKASGGRVSRKFGGGIMTKKSNTQKIQEAFGTKKNKKLSTKQMKIAKLAGNPNKIDAADFAKLRKS